MSKNNNSKKNNSKKNISPVKALFERQKRQELLSNSTNVKDNKKSKKNKRPCKGNKRERCPRKSGMR